MFTKSDLKTGMFGLMSDDQGYFVVVDNKIVYQYGGWDDVIDLDDDLEFGCWYIEKLYEGVSSFGNLRENIKGNAHNGTLVYDRERDTKKLYNGKVVCVERGNNPQYKVGKIYQFKDGMMTADNGRNYPTTKKVYSFEDWDKWTSAKFIEVVE
jgi:hypothetical protein